MRRENPDYLERIYKAVWEACGATPEHAEIMAQAISAGDRNGKLGQGLAVFEIPFIMWEYGMLDIEAKPEVVQQGRNYVVVDGNRSSGQWTCHIAMQEAIKKAKKNTIGIAWVRRLNDAGFLAYYVRQVLEHDMVGIGSLNTVPLTAPYGGREAVISAAPFTIVCPAGEQRPIIFDSAVCEMYDYYLVMAAADGKRVQSKSIIDPKTGELTDDPKPYVEQPYTRISTILAPTVFSSPKLYGFNVFTEILTGMLTPGGMTSNQLPYPADEYETGDVPTSVGGGFFMAINVADLMPVDEFEARADGYVRAIKACKPAPGFDEIYLPGERGLMKEEHAKTEGVEFRDEAWEKLVENARQVGVDVEALR